MSRLLKFLSILGLAFAVTLTLGFSTPIKILKATGISTDYTCDENGKSQDDSSEFDDHLVSKSIYIHSYYLFDNLIAINTLENLFFFNEQFNLSHYTTPPFRPPAFPFKIS